jgi:hypothetical protein
MQEREAIALKKSGDLVNLSIYRQPKKEGWIIKLHTRSGGGKEDTLVTKREKTSRVFKTSDAALRWSLRMGFNEVTVLL